MTSLERRALIEIAAELTPDHLLMVIQFANAVRQIEREQATATTDTAKRAERQTDATLQTIEHYLRDMDEGTLRRVLWYVRGVALADHRRWRDI